VKVKVTILYPNELEVKNNNGNQRSVSDFDLHLEIKYGGRSKTKLYTQNVMNLLLVGFVLFIFFT
jgi:hypothetical protein